MEQLSRFSCFPIRVTDSLFSFYQLQIFNQLEFLGNDYHPDAHACRLKISAVTVGLGEDAMKCPWSIYEEFRHYVRKHEYVSSACRLTYEEEMLLMKLSDSETHEKTSIEILNRKAFVSGVSHLYSLSSDASITVKFGSKFFPKFENFDGDPDESILMDPKNSNIGSKIFGAAYSRPDVVSN